MKVLHLLSSDRLSGAENVAVEIIRMFDGTADGISRHRADPFRSPKCPGVKHFPLRSSRPGKLSRWWLATRLMLFAHDISHLSRR